MRVALVARNFTLGGSLERTVVFRARSLQQHGIEVHCYCNPETRTVDVPGVTFHDVSPAVVSRSRIGCVLECGSFATAATRALRRDRGRYDIVDVSGIGAWEHDVVTVHGVTKANQRRWPQEAGRRYRAARARVLVAPVIRPQTGLARTIERLQFRPGRFARVIAVTDQVARDLVEVHHIPQQLIDVIPYPVEVARFARANGGRVRQQFGVLAEEPLLLFVGHGFERKGLFEAIEALEAIQPRAHLLVVGGGDRERFARAATVAGVQDYVHFVGGTEAPETFYREADLLVFPTRQEPWGIPLIEAMASGLPVVTTEVAGAARAVENARAGVVLPSTASPKHLAETISSLLRDPAQMRTMGERGREAARSFDSDTLIEQVLTTYRRAVEQRSVN